MFARKVSMQLKPDGAAEFKKKIEDEIIPVLRKQKGFVDEITFLYPNRKEKKSTLSAYGKPLKTRRPTTAVRIGNWRKAWRR